jgi:hypothetical protein
MKGFIRVFASVALVLFTGAIAFAADVDGKWTGSVQTPQGDLPVNFTFKAEGSNLTGSTMGFDGGEVPIKDGKIDGTTITFTVTFDLGGMPLTLSYKGIVSPSDIKISGDAFGMPFEFVLKKAS